MGSTKHEKSFVDFDKPYEQNVIGLKGIVYFGIGLFILIVITFALMFALLNVLEDNAEPTMSSSNPMSMTDRERLPPEPRLQSAPGFGVDSSAGRVNMELGVPQAEYQELHRQWVETWKNGNKDAKTGAITSLPIDNAKEIFLGQAVKARSGPEAEKSAAESRMFISDSSAGRTATIRRR